jgi:hypothetical protein
VGGGREERRGRRKGCGVYNRILFISRVVDLGVMTPCEKIIKAAIDERAGNATVCADFVCVHVKKVAPRTSIPKVSG